MKDTGQQPMTVVLRRFENEHIVLAPADGVEKQAGAACTIAARQFGDAYAYYLRVPDCFVVLPPDWRRFAYDHDKIKELLTSCVKDNVSQFLYEPRSAETKELIERTLRVALTDLCTVFDTKFVECSSDEPGVLRIEIRGEHKNGMLASLQLHHHQQL